MSASEYVAVFGPSAWPAHRRGEVDGLPVLRVYDRRRGRWDYYVAHPSTLDGPDLVASAVHFYRRDHAPGWVLSRLGGGS